MADKLIKYYNYVAEQKGILAKGKLAELTAMPSVIAATQPDSRENIEKFKAAVAKITGSPAPEF